jgi:hypothetical protein
MTPKNKAIELIDKMYNVMDIQDGDLWKSTKQCALIAVDEIETLLLEERIFESFDYWKEVKQEIENL